MLRGVRKSYDGVEFLCGLDFTLEPGEFVCVVGRSGCGKSTLLRLIAGIEGAHGGTIQSDPSLGVSFQESRLIPWLKVWKNVILGMTSEHNLTGDSRSSGKPAFRELAVSALQDVGLADKADAWPLTLSGGQAQRVSLARALVRKPRLLLLDEPFGALDAFTRRDMQGLLTALVKQYGLSVVMVTHDLEEAMGLADRILVLAEGRFIHEEHRRNDGTYNPDFFKVPGSNF
jgi:sulfonate transport system ATP-binding protein